MKHPNPGIAYFNDNAASLAQQYNALDRAKVHQDLLSHLPAGAGLRVLDIGSGSGVDAALFAERGHHVTAVEPASALMTEARKTFPHQNIRYVEDTLPALEAVQGEFDVVLATGVVQYLAPGEREQSLSRIFALVAKGGIVGIQYPTPASRVAQFDIGNNEITDFLKSMDQQNASEPRFKVLTDTSILDMAGRKALNGGSLSFKTLVIQRVK